MRRVAIFAIFIATLSGCAPSEGSQLPAGVVAMVNGEPLTAVDLRNAYITASRDVRKRAARWGGRHYLLDQAIDELLLHQEARRRGMYPSFDDRLQHSAKTDQFLEKVFEPTFEPVEPTKEELLAQHEVAKKLGDLPPTILLELLYADTEDEALELIEATREAQREGDLEMFLRRNQAGSMVRGGVLSQQEVAHFLGQRLAAALFSMPADEVVYSRPFRIRRKYAAAVVVERYDEITVSYERAEPQYRRQIEEVQRREALERFADGFREHFEITISRENLALVPWRRGGQKKLSTSGPQKN